MPRTALFVVDIQVELAGDPETQIPHAERIRNTGQVILSKARAANALIQDADIDVRIIFVQHHEMEGEGTLLKGSKAWELVFKPMDEREYFVEKSRGEYGNLHVPIFFFFFGISYE